MHNHAQPSPGKGQQPDALAKTLAVNNLLQVYSPYLESSSSIKVIQQIQNGEKALQSLLATVADLARTEKALLKENAELANRLNRLHSLLCQQ